MLGLKLNHGSKSGHRKSWEYAKWHTGFLFAKLLGFAYQLWQSIGTAGFRTNVYLIQNHVHRIYDTHHIHYIICHDTYGIFYGYTIMYVHLMGFEMWCALKRLTEHIASCPHTRRVFRYIKLAFHFCQVPCYFLFPWTLSWHFVLDCFIFCNCGSISYIRTTFQRLNKINTITISSFLP